MPMPTPRPSLLTTLDQRYAVQHAGSAFEVKDILEAPGVQPQAGTTIDAFSMNGEAFQIPNGFQVKMLQQESQLIAVVSNNTVGLSRYVENLDRTRYHPTLPLP